MGEHVLVPIDGSPASKAALDYALTQHEVEITVLTVVNPFDIDPLSPGYKSPLGKAGMPAYSQEWYQKEWDNAKQLHEELREKADDVPFESVVALGQPARQIVKHATKHDVDHIMIGTHGKEDLSNVFLGSVAEKVAHRAPMTVTIVK
ncbi:Nucleotide-binding universal stress protein, UspA family [Haladaptatus litoreus]|uniref:Nucleotide-binding universal stress protein, UspA family n=1 Tax=Haladaptatus litoreus TaxID=553468 RepID=A0A1N7BDD7_9EURY|nr:universal stress protein [Haladaptatus litoreus]SIR49340.1 Nucleotide-binding universal stress protein, UspA family [Haladaptatus litoreus]